jgi:putative endonuclease
MYYVYILTCVDQSLYIGATNNLERRIHEHNHSKRGARYTKARRPVRLAYQKSYRTLADARKREAELKRLKRKEKLKLIATAKKS